MRGHTAVVTNKDPAPLHPARRPQALIGDDGSVGCRCGSWRSEEAELKIKRDSFPSVPSGPVVGVGRIGAPRNVHCSVRTVRVPPACDSSMTYDDGLPTYGSWMGSSGLGCTSRLENVPQGRKDDMSEHFAWQIRLVRTSLIDGAWWLATRGLGSEPASISREPDT